MNAMTQPSIWLRAILAFWGLSNFGCLVAEEPSLPMTTGKFTPTLESLKQFQCPVWFRDAKFGIWAHWGPQAVPMAGDWYAKHTYVQGHPQYQNHLENYGHPSTSGYKDIIPLWKAERFDPDRLMSLYKRAGARYFVSMGVHHDNFDLWNSTYQRWNAVQMGPHRDIVGAWKNAAKRQGLRFGVSEHLGASFTWFQDSHKTDKTGPLAGLPYDGANPQYQDLYHWPAEAGDTGWYSKDPRWHALWYKRIKDLVDQYHPDLLYTDGGLPFGQYGQSLVAHLYNTSAKKPTGPAEAVYTCKQKSEGRWVEDLERGVMPGINPDPWQTDTSIGDWYYNKNWKFRPVSWTIHMLVDIVSKNGNLLLNVVQRPDGSLDPEVEQSLEQLAAWIKIHGEGIYGTRPWLTYGEGPVRTKGGHFKEDFTYTARDIRFTSKAGKLYAFALGWPDEGQLLIRSLPQVPGTSSNRISHVELVGASGKLKWTQTSEGLSVSLPQKRTSDVAIALRISGKDLVPVQAPIPPVVIKPGDDGCVKLEADTAELHGTLGTETRDGQTNIGFWENASDYATWDRVSVQAGAYRVSAEAGTVSSGAEFLVEIAGRSVVVRVPNTGAWEKFAQINAGDIQVAQSGTVVATVRAVSAATWKPINLRRVTLKPAAP